MKTGQWYLWLIVLLPALFWGEHFEIEKYRVKAHIFSNGTLRIEETIHVLFYEPRRGIYRTIPTRLQSDTFIHRFHFTDIQVEHFPFQVSHSGNLLKIRIGSPSHYVEGRQVYIISYSVQNPILVFSNKMNEPWQSFYWNLIGADWDVPIRQAFFEITLDKEWETPEYSVFVGSVGSTNTKRVETTYDKNSHTIRGRLLGELHPREGITIISSFPMGLWPLNDSRSFWEKYVFPLWKRYGLFLSWLFIFLYTASLFLLWAKFGKDKPFSRMVHFYPPHDLHPAEAGMLIDNTIDQRDCIATIFKWAGEGYITIEEKQKVFGRDFIFHNQRPLSNPKPYETTLWEGLFGKSSEEQKSVSLSNLTNVFYTAFSKAQNEIRDSVCDKSLYKPYSRELGVLFVFLGFTWITAGILVAAFNERGYFFLIGAILSAVSFFFAKIMPARTEIGQKYYEHLVGFREFMKRAEWPRLERLLKEDSLYFDKTLPYAIIFGLEKRWINKFSPFLQQSPSWYMGTGHFSSHALSRSIHSAIHTMGITMTSSPSSATSSGGGFSGGGGGGGGGGSW